MCESKGASCRDDYVTKMIAEQQAREEAQCPACKYVFDPEDLDGLVTYYGEDGPQDVCCPNCEASLTVNETVTREFEVTDNSKHQEGSGY